MRHGTQPQNLEGVDTGKRNFLKAAAALAAAPLACMAPRHRIFGPTPAGETAALTEDVHRAFLNKVLRSPDYRAEISGRDGTVGPYSYRLVRRQGEERVYRFAHSLPLGKRESSPEVQLGPDSHSFRLPIEPTGDFACDIIANTRGNLVSFSFLNPEGSWEEISTMLRDSPGLRFEALYSPVENRLIVLASPTLLEEGMPAFISTVSLDLRTGGLERLDYVRPAK